MIPFGTTKDGREVHKVTLFDGNLSVSILTWGAVVQDVRLAGVDRSLTLGSDTLSDYEGAMRYHGSLIGPIVNRISTSRVLIDGMMYELERNMDGRLHIHSGSDSTLLQVWDVVEVTNTSLTLRCDLVDGQCGLPGNRTIEATYSISAPATLSLAITGTTDAATLMNFANHSYWNFDGTEDWSGHTLHVHADQFLPTTDDFYPTGEIADVEGSALNFRNPRVIDPQNPPMDTNFCLSTDPQPLREVLTLTGASGVRMKVHTDQNGIQVYDGRHAIRPGKKAYEGLAIEAQNWPDAPTHRGFPSIKVTPDTPYTQDTEWSFFKP
ncbi:aldose 1-epimerase [Cognatiyoonia sediminum]|uniref:Aldose 1-epimerase n=1 Tax=Cognatiyoonia sediminum TaxID=1508389 RepID=A0A1M5PP42_9RHOB|nr:aldose epimerase family protein [Cognatiyoonia sediminum]SHH03488.1 aldose 1-epimerase [Cognatiyoonia sediminum]